MKRFALFLLASVFTASGIANAEQASAPYAPQQTVHETPDKATLTLYVQTTVQTPVDPVREQVIVEAETDGYCPQWAGLAYDIGWPVDQIPKLLRIIHRESRCLPDACSQSDSGRVCRDWGLTQINDHSWKSTIRKQGLEMSDMWNPELNLRFALWLYTYSQERNGDGWQPWDLQST